MNIAIIGAGLIGQKRADNLPPGTTIITICDINIEKAAALATKCGSGIEKNWKKVISDPRINAIFIATTHNLLTTIGKEAIRNRKHVMIEKPGGTTPQDIDMLIRSHKKTPVVVAFGYNHRFHPSIQKAKEIIDSGQYGPILFIRAKYGHGARVNYEKEWRFNKKISGGGELIDQGPHLIDLVNFFGVKMKDTSSRISTVFWQTKLEDTAFIIAKNSQRQLVNLSVSCVEWKNTFSFEIMLKTAKIQIDGLGKSYGQERLTLYRMKPEMGPPDMDVFEYPGEDFSWKIENEQFFDRIIRKDLSTRPLLDAREVLKVINDVYNQNK